MKKAVSRPVIIAVSLTLALAVILRFDMSEWVRGGDGWRWQYDVAPAAYSVPLAGALIVYLAGCWLLVRRGAKTAVIIGWSIAGTVFIGLMGTAIHDGGNPFYSLFVRTTALLGTGPHWAANHIDWAGGEWQDWTAVMDKFGGHMRNVPPGSVAWYELLNRTFGQAPGLSATLYRVLLPYQCQNFDLLNYPPEEWASATFGMLMPLWSALSILPLYVLSKRVVGADARLVVMGYALIPGLTGFGGSWSTLYPLFSVLALWLLVRGLERQRGGGWLALSGLVTGLGLFTNFALIPLPAFLGLYTLVDVLLARRQHLWQAVQVGLWFGAGLLVPWVIFWLLTGQTFFDLLETSMQFHLGISRNYLFWLVYHPWDWVMWSGLGLMALSLYGVIRWWRGRKDLSVPVLNLSLLFMMLILSISGTARGETGRVWLFFSPFLLVTAVQALRWAEGASPARGWAMMTAAQAIGTLAILSSLNVMGSSFTPPPPTPLVSANRTVDATFSLTTDAPLFSLSGWDAQMEGDALRLNLHWQGIDQPLSPFWFGAVLVSPGGQTYSVPAWQPGGDVRYPTTCWQPGSTIGDSVLIPLPANPESGDWWISLAVYANPQQGAAQLIVSQAGQTPDKQIGLGPVRIG